MLRPTRPLPLRSGERVNLLVVRNPDPKRWNLERLAKGGVAEDLTLSEQGLADWAAKVEGEDRH